MEMLYTTYLMGKLYTCPSLAISLHFHTRMSRLKTSFVCLTECNGFHLNNNSNFTLVIFVIVVNSVLGVYVYRVGMYVCLHHYIVRACPQPNYTHESWIESYFIVFRIRERKGKAQLSCV